MYPAPFEYYKAGSVEETIELLADHGDREVEILAGGHSLLPTMKSGLANPDVLVDIGGLDDLRGISRTGNTLSVGALTPYAEVASDKSVYKDATTFAEAAHAIGDIQVRNRGTVGGNVAHADPASDLPAAVVASNASIHVQGPSGSRVVAADDFFQGMYDTDVGEGEVVTQVDLPTYESGEVGAYVKKPSPSSGYAMVGVAAVISAEGGTVESARVAANGALDHATRLTAVEQALEGAPIEGAADAASHSTEGIEDWQLMEDLQASSEYREQLLEVYTRKAIEKVADSLGN